MLLVAVAQVIVAVLLEATVSNQSLPPTPSEAFRRATPREALHETAVPSSVHATVRLEEFRRPNQIRALLHQVPRCSGRSARARSICNLRACTEPSRARD